VPRTRVEFHVPFENIYPPVFVCKEYLLCLAVWRPCPSYFLSTCIHIWSFRSSSSYPFFQVDQMKYLLCLAALKILFRGHRIFSTVFSSRNKICLLNLSWSTKQFFNIGITISTRPIRSMEKDFCHIYQLWKVFRRIRNQTAAHGQKGDKCPLTIKIKLRKKLMTKIICTVNAGKV